MRQESHVRFQSARSARGYARPPSLPRRADRQVQPGRARCERTTRSARPAGDLRPGADDAARILPPVEQRRDGNRLLPRRIVDLGEAGIFDTVHGALEHRRDFPRADPGRRAANQMKTLADFDPDGPAHSPAADISTAPFAEYRRNSKPSISRSVLAIYFLFPVFLTVAFFLARPGLRRARTGDEALNFTVLD